MLNKPKVRTTVGRQPYITVTMRVLIEEGARMYRAIADSDENFDELIFGPPIKDEEVLCGVIAFNDDAVRALKVLNKDDAVAVNGAAKLVRLRNSLGAEVAGLAIIAHNVLALPEDDEDVDEGFLDRERELRLMLSDLESDTDDYARGKETGWPHPDRG